MTEKNIYDIDLEITGGKMANSMQTLKFFISYSHLDMKYKEKLLTALKSLDLTYNIDLWHDGKILAGGDINKTILQELENSDVVILLITPNFLASWYCMEIELIKSIKRMEKGKCIVVPVIFQDCVLDENLPFYDLNRVPRDGKPICRYKPQLQGCTAATNMIKEMIDRTFPNSKRSVKSPKAQNKVNNSSGELYIDLYKNGKLQHIAVNQNFINILPEYTRNIADFNIMMEQALENAIKRFRKEYRNLSKKKNVDKNLSKKRIEDLEVEQLRLFLMDICGYIKKYITDSVGIRVHFRGTTNNQYIGIVASTDNEDSDDLATDWSTDLTPIPIYKGLIHYSAKLKSSLLKSLNPKLNFKGNNDKIWKEYLTHTFVNLNNGKQPVLSMGISVHKDYYPLKKELFLFLAYVRIGELIEKYIIKYCKKCKSIDKYYDIEIIINNIA